MPHAIAKYVRMSPRKLRRVINVIRGKRATEAQIVLKFMPYAASRIVEKVLKSAVANATNNENLNVDELKITKAYVDGSTTLRRWRAMSRGRGYPILKRTSHVTIEVVPDTTSGEIKYVTDTKTTVHKHEHKTKEKHDHAHEVKPEKVKEVKKVKSKTKERKSEKKKGGK